MSWGIYFAAYNRAKARYQRRSGSAKLGPGMHLAAAAEAGALVRALLGSIRTVWMPLRGSGALLGDMDEPGLLEAVASGISFGGIYAPLSCIMQPSAAANHEHSSCCASSICMELCCVS